MDKKIYNSDLKTKKGLLVANGTYRGYDFYIKTLGTHPCAYVRISDKSSLKYSIVNQELYFVNGGITYSNKALSFDNAEIDNTNSWFIGWDYAHYGDFMLSKNGEILSEGKVWTIGEIIEECHKAIDEIIEREKEYPYKEILVNIKTNDATITRNIGQFNYEYRFDFITDLIEKNNLKNINTIDIKIV